MTAELRLVFDTNVLVSATINATSTPGIALKRGLAAGRVLLSAEGLVELEDVLRRPKFRRYFSSDNRDDFLAALRLRAEWVEPQLVVIDCRDPKDNKFLELAVSGGATHLVTGDDDLLVLHPFRGVAILTPQAFLDEFSMDSAGELKS